MNKAISLLMAAFCGMILFSCQDDGSAEISPLKVGTGETSLDAVQINIQSERDILLSGGNGKYKASIEDSRIATVRVVGDTLRLKGLEAGETYINIRSHEQQHRLAVDVRSASPVFSEDIIRIFPDKEKIRKFVSLTGGDEQTVLEVIDPDKILEVKWNGKNDLLEIKAFYEGDAYIRAKSPDGKEVQMKVEVRVEDEPQKVGIYHTSSRYVSNNVALSGVLIVQRKDKGVWISNTATPYGGNVVYTASCMRIDPIINPKEGEYITISIHSFSGAKAIPAGEYKVLVEKIKGNLVQLRGKRHKFLLPYEMR